MLKTLTITKVFYLLLLLFLLKDIVTAFKADSWLPLIPIAIGWTVGNIIMSIIWGLFGEDTKLKEDGE